jgi:PAS domain S-box-containing protein
VTTSDEDAATSALWKSEELSRALLEAAPDAMVVVDARGLIRLINRQTEKLFGYSREDLLGKAIDVLVPDRFRERHSHQVREFSAAPRAHALGHRKELQARRKDGSEFPADISLSPMSSSAGVLTIAAIRDVTARRQAEEVRAAHRESEEARSELEALLANIPDFVLTLDANGLIRYINKVVPPYDGGQVIGTSWLSYVQPYQHEIVQSALRQALDFGKPAAYELNTLMPDGQSISFANHMGPIWRDEEIVGAVIIARDVTEQRRTEAQLMVSDRMASVGTLAAGVAHEINNPLSAVLGNLELALGETKVLGQRIGTNEIGDLQDELQDARDAAERVRQIVRDLRIFSRTEADKREPVDVQRVLESSLRMAWNEIRHRARLATEYNNTPAVEANESRLGQVFLNLIVNAAQAIPEGNAETNRIRVVTGLDSAGRVQVDIHDTGPGIPPEVLRRLFTPFFTTKPAGVGTGLGLSICQRIVTGLGGEIRVQSRVGHGTTFSVLLPASRLDPVVTPLVAPVRRTAIRRGRILVVDDEAMVGATIRRALAAEHDVTTTDNAADALALLDAGQRFDLIFSDLMMPQMTGMDFYERLQINAAEQGSRVIFLTGGAFTQQAQDFLDRVPNQRVEKPFDVAQLRSIVNERIR